MKATKTVVLFALLVACADKSAVVPSKSQPSSTSVAMRPSEIRDFCAPYLKDNADMWDECIQSLSTPLPQGVDLKHWSTWPDCQADPSFGDITPKSVRTVCLYGDEELDQSSN